MEAELKRTVTRALHRPPLPKPQREGDHSLRYPFFADVAWVAARYLRTPSRVLWELADLRARRLEPLFAEVRSLAARADAPWQAPGLGISVVVARHGDFPAGPLQIRGTIKNALLEGSREAGRPLRFAPDRPDLVFDVRGRTGRLRLSLDLGAGSLHRRGYRQHIGPAPLKETLAAQLLILARWDARTEALVDPMAGAGTIALEAALMATGEPLGRPAPALDALSVFSPYRGSERALFGGTDPVVVAGEPEPQSFRALLANARAAGVDDRVRCVAADFRSLWAHLDVPERGLVVVNPPYGARLAGGLPVAEGSGSPEDEIEALHRALLAWHAALGSAWRLGVLTTHGALDTMTDRRCRMKKPLRNGPLKAWFWLFDGR